MADTGTLTVMLQGNDTVTSLINANPNKHRLIDENLTSGIGIKTSAAITLTFNLTDNASRYKIAFYRQSGGGLYTTPMKLPAGDTGTLTMTGSGTAKVYLEGDYVTQWDTYTDYPSLYEIVPILYGYVANYTITTVLDTEGNAITDYSITTPRGTYINATWVMVFEDTGSVQVNATGYHTKSYAIDPASYIDNNIQYMANTWVNATDLDTGSAIPATCYNSSWTPVMVNNHLTLPPGTTALTCTSPGYMDKAVNFVKVAGTALIQDVALQPSIGMLYYLNRQVNATVAKQCGATYQTPENNDTYWIYLNPDEEGCKVTTCFQTLNNYPHCIQAKATDSLQTFNVTYIPHTTDAHLAYLSIVDMTEGALGGSIIEAYLTNASGQYLTDRKITNDDSLGYLYALNGSGYVMKVSYPGYTTRYVLMTYQDLAQTSLSYPYTIVLQEDAVSANTLYRMFSSVGAYYRNSSTIEISVTTTDSVAPTLTIDGSAGYRYVNSLPLASMSYDNTTKVYTYRLLNDSQPFYNYIRGSNFTVWAYDGSTPVASLTLHHLDTSSEIDLSGVMATSSKTVWVILFFMVLGISAMVNILFKGQYGLETYFILSMILTFYSPYFSYGAIIGGITLFARALVRVWGMNSET